MLLEVLLQGRASLRLKLGNASLIRQRWIGGHERVRHHNESGVDGITGGLCHERTSTRKPSRLRNETRAQGASQARARRWAEKPVSLRWLESTLVLLELRRDRRNGGRSPLLSELAREAGLHRLLELGGLLWDPRLLRRKPNLLLSITRWL